jgi:hypothetical protein
MQDFRELKVWEKGHRLTLAVYRVTGGFPKDELYGMTGQIRRSCVSANPSPLAGGAYKSLPPSRGKHTSPFPPCGGRLGWGDEQQ